MSDVGKQRLQAKSWLVLLAPVLLFPLLAWSWSLEGGAQSRVEKLMNAVESGSYGRFVEDGTVLFQEQLLKSQFRHVHEQLAERLSHGYRLEYLGTLRQEGLNVHLWRITYKDGEDQTLAKLVLRGTKTAGFWLH